MLTFKNITLKDLKNHIFIENFNYSLGNQDKVGIIGEEGNGKSTFLKAIYDKAWIEDYMVMSGDIKSDFKHIGYLPQQLPQAWMNCTVFEYLLKNKPEEDIPYERYNDLKELEILCKDLKLNVSVLQNEQIMNSLSGGEKVKVQMMKLLASHVDLLLLDEPTNDLDIHTLEWMENFIRESNLPIMFISHDSTLLNNAANVILHFEQVNKQSKCRYTVYRGTYNEYVSQRHSKLTKDIQVAHKEKQEYTKRKIKLNDQMNAVHDALNDTVRNPGVAASLKSKMSNIKSQEKRFEKESYSKVDSTEEAIQIFFEDVNAISSKIILELQMDTLMIEERVLIRDIDILVKGKDKVVFIGDNGCGKSILMKDMHNRLKQRSDICLGYMPQNYADLMDMSKTPIEFLMTSGDKEDITRCRDLLGSMKFTSEEMLHPIKNTSEGQKAKLYILRFIKEKCNVLLLDEPTRNLSPLSAPVIIDVLKKYQGCIISVSHDRTFIEEVFETRYYIENQEIQMQKIT
ncbi:ATP-binding cassette domain-containing protein [Amedibacillus sp. YH-ame6]